MKLLQSFGYILLLGVYLNTFALDSPIQSNQVVTFFPDIGYPVEEGKFWELNIHGWIYEPDLMSDISLFFREWFGMEEYPVETGETLSKQRARLFFVDNEKGKAIPIRLGKQEFLLPKSGENGHFYGILRLPAEEVEKLRNRGDNSLHFEAVMGKNDNRRFTGNLFLVEPTGLSIISDIDDTIKITEVHSKKLLFNNTFIEPFRPVPGMATFYQKWATEQNALFHYISASPWQLFLPLNQFLKEYGFPQGTFHLRLFRVKDNSFIDFLKSSQSHKVEQIKKLLDHSHDRRFILIGDSGEADAFIYADIAHAYPNRIEHIFIREVMRKSGEQLDYIQIFNELPTSLWTVLKEGTIGD